MSRIIKFEFGNIDVELLDKQKGYLIDTCDLEPDKEYINAYIGIIDILNLILVYGANQPGVKT